MFGKSPEWPPRKSRKEPDGAWLARLDSEIKLKYLHWVDLLNQGEAGSLIEVAEMASAVVDINVMAAGEDFVGTDEEITAIMSRARANYDQNMAAVRDGNPRAVAHYAEQHLVLHKANHS